MKRLPFAVLLLLAVACASSNSPGSKSAKPDPPMDIEQLVGPADLGYPYGPIEVQYQLVIQNPTPQPITLIRVDVSTISGGPYTLRRAFYNVKKTIAPNATDGVTFWARAFAYGRNIRDSEPITIRTIAYFESPAGNFQKIFMRELQQYPQ